MLFEEITIADLQRLVAALKSAGGEDVIERIIANTAAQITPHGRVTMGMVQKLLDQTNGCTILSAEAVACLQPTEPMPAKAESGTEHNAELFALIERTFGNIGRGTASKRGKSFEKLVAACKFVHVDKYFTEKHFPLDRWVSIPAELTSVKACSFAKRVSATGVTAALHSNERLVGIYQALECVAENPQLVPARGQLVILGARWFNKNDRQEYVPIIYHYTRWGDRIGEPWDGLCLGLTSTALEFGESCEFLVGVEKEKGSRGGICL